MVQQNQDPFSFLFCLSVLHNTPYGSLILLKTICNSMHMDLLKNIDRILKIPTTHLYSIIPFALKTLPPACDLENWFCSRIFIS